MKSVNKLLKNPAKVVFLLDKVGVSKLIPDKMYLKLKYKASIGRKLNLKNPVLYSEKLQWLKINDHNPEYMRLVDKVTAKQWAEELLGKEYIIPTLGVWENFDDIDFDALPNQFVLKCTHDSGGVVVVRDKSKFDKDAARKIIEKSLKRNYYYVAREWPYKNLPRRIICEEYMTDSPDVDTFTDYKIFCFNGVADSVCVCLDREKGNTRFYYFDKEWNFKRYNECGMAAPADFSVPKPDCIDEMFRIAEKLSVGIPIVRVDLYKSNDQIYFGEMTFFSSGGFGKTLLLDAEKYFGELIDLDIVRRR